MKRVAAAALMLVLFLGCSAAQALTVTGLETEIVDRDWAASLFFPRMEELTGVEVTARGVSDVNEYESLIQEMIGGNVQTDALFKANLTREQEIRLIESGAVIDLAPLIDAHMPNLSALLAEHPEWRDVITLEDGRIASLPLITEKERQVCVWINRAWIEKLGLAMPTTPEELTAVLTAMKNGDPNGNGDDDEVAADLLGVYEMRWLLPYFGIVADDYNVARDESGKLVFAPEMPQYRAFIEMLKEWADEGLLPGDAFTMTHASLALSAEEEEKETTSGLVVSLTPFTHVPVDAVADYEALLMPDESGSVRWRDLLGEVWTGCFAVTSACKDPAQALVWADALYGAEGALLAYGGVEGEDYVYGDNGYWTFMIDEMRTINHIRSSVIIYTGTAPHGRFPAAFVYGVDSEMDRYVFEQSERARAVAEQVTPQYCLSMEDQEKAREIAAKTGELVDRGIAKFVTGETELTDETYAAWIEEMKAADSETLVALFENAQ